MQNMLTELELEYDKNKILEEMKDLEFHPFNELGPDGKGKTKIPKSSWFYKPSTWLQVHIKEEDLDITSEIKMLYVQLRDLLKTEDIRARFYKQAPNTEVPMHSDRGTKCCVNIMLSDNYAPITFEESGDHFYKCALLNIQKQHSVKSHDKERVLIKFSIFDVEYNEAVKRMKNGI